MCATTSRISRQGGGRGHYKSAEESKRRRGVGVLDPCKSTPLRPNPTKRARGFPPIRGRVGPPPISPSLSRPRSVLVPRSAEGLAKAALPADSVTSHRQRRLTERKRVCPLARAFSRNRKNARFLARAPPLTASTGGGGGGACETPRTRADTTPGWQPFAGPTSDARDAQHGISGTPRALLWREFRNLVLGWRARQLCEERRISSLFL